MDPARREPLSLSSEHLAFFRVGEDDARLLASLRPILEASVGHLIDASSAHLLAFAPTAAVLQADPHLLGRFRDALPRYLSGWTSGSFDDAYLASRKAIGELHQALGIRPEWCIGLEALWLCSILETLFDEMAVGPILRRTILALVKIALFDLGVVLNSYMDTGFVPRIVLNDAERRAETARDALRVHEVMDRKKDEVLHLLIHDFAAPLQGMSLRSEISSRAASTIIDDQYKIRRACRDLSTLLRDALDAGTLETGELQARCEPVGLHDVLADVIAECQALAGERGITLLQTCEGNPSARADPGLLKRVVTNLVVNAIRHSGSDCVRLEAGTRETYVVIRVIDHGRGIARSDAEEIFRKFRHGPDSAGTGLGLYFCKLAVDAMDGRLGVESEPGITVFEVALQPAV